MFDGGVNLGLVEDGVVTLSLFIFQRSVWVWPYSRDNAKKTLVGWTVGWFLKKI